VSRPRSAGGMAAPFSGRQFCAALAPNTTP
jgi:hypothetical protein